MSNAYVDHIRKQAKGLIPVQTFYIVKEEKVKTEVEGVKVRMVTPAAVTTATAHEDVKK